MSKVFAGCGSAHSDRVFWTKHTAQKEWQLDKACSGGLTPTNNAQPLPTYVARNIAANLKGGVRARLSLNGPTFLLKTPSFGFYVFTQCISPWLNVRVEPLHDAQKHSCGEHEFQLLELLSLAQLPTLHNAHVLCLCGKPFRQRGP